MFVDASAAIAIIAAESDSESLLARLRKAERVFASPMVVWEAAVGLAKQKRCPLEEAEAMVGELLQAAGADLIAIDAEIGREAIRASRLYGKGRHDARLNFGDCFAYACAKVLNVPLLAKGNDFPLTDIKLA